MWSLPRSGRHLEPHSKLEGRRPLWDSSPACRRANCTRDCYGFRAHSSLLATVILALLRKVYGPCARVSLLIEAAARIIVAERLEEYM